MGIFARVQTLVRAYSNNLLDQAVDMNSIPVLRQYIRDLEDAMDKTKHEAAVAAAHVTTLNSQAASLQDDITSNTNRAKAFLAKTPPDEVNARVCAGHIHDSQEQLADIQTQIEAAKTNSASLDAVVGKLNTKHQAIMSQLRILESKDSTSRSLEQATASLKQAQSFTADGTGADVDSMTQKINARADVANEEFNRTVGEMTPPPDPLRDDSVNSILDSLREKQPTGVS